MECKKCKKEEIVFDGFAGRCKNCGHVEYLDPFISRRINPMTPREAWDRFGPIGGRGNFSSY